MQIPWYIAAGIAAAVAGGAALVAGIRARNQSLLRYALLRDSTRTIVLVLRRDGRIEDANQAAMQCYGYTLRELLQLNVADLCAQLPTPADMERFLSSREVGTRTYEGTHRRKNGSSFAVEATFSTGRIGGQRKALMLVQDITRRKQQEAARSLLHDMAHRMLQKQPMPAVLEALCQGLATLYGFLLVWVGLREENGVVRPAAKAGPGTRRLDGLTLRWAPEPNAPTARAIATGEYRLTWIEADPRVVTEPRSAHIFGACSVLALPLTVHGRTIGALSLHAGDPDAFSPEHVQQLRSFADQMALLMQAQAEQQKVESDLRQLALKDPLTGLPNRRALQEHLGQVVARARPDRQAALLLLDLDHFKLVNDALGHSGGDDFLVAVAQALRAALPPDSLLARFDGDEFAVVLPATTAQSARAVAGVLQEAAGAVRLERNGRHVVSGGASVGIALTGGAARAGDLMTLADSALFSAQELGKHQVVLYETGQDRPGALAEAGRLASAVRSALHDNSLVLLFQPVVRLQTGAVTHYEALLRLPDGDGLLAPASFLGAAERFQLMPAVDRWVVTRVLQHLEQRPDIQVSVNLSGQSLGDEALLAELPALLAAVPDLACRLLLEITETAAIRDLARTQRWMEQMRALGVRFALDDFGAGFSSFAYLRALPADSIKIDGSFICNLESDATNRTLVEAIHDTARLLGKSVVAEWVENEATADLLRDLGVEYGQGYRWGEPAPLTPGSQS